MIFKNKAVVVLFCCLMAAASAKAADSLLPFSLNDDPVWTDRPVRVDRSKQSFERVPGFIDRHFLKLRVKPRARMHDGASFESDGRIYVLKWVVGMKSGKRFCHTDKGAAFACGGQSRRMLKRLVTGHLLECTSEVLTHSTSMIDCRIGRHNLAEKLVASGLVHAVPGSGLKSVEREAIKNRSGMWRDPACRKMPGDC